MIISVVILAMVKMYSNNTFLFDSYKKHAQINQYASFLIANKEYGYENKNITLYDLVNEFDMEDELRRKLKAKKAQLAYKVVKNIDLSEDSNESAPQMSLEIGQTVLRVETNSVAMMRLQLR